MMIWLVIRVDLVFKILFLSLQFHAIPYGVYSRISIEWTFMSMTLSNHCYCFVPFERAVHSIFHPQRGYHYLATICTICAISSFFFLKFFFYEYPEHSCPTIFEHWWVMLFASLLSPFIYVKEQEGEAQIEYIVFNCP